MCRKKFKSVHPSLRKGRNSGLWSHCLTLHFPMRDITNGKNVGLGLTGQLGQVKTEGRLREEKPHSLYYNSDFIMIERWFHMGEVFL